jgi:hypothetical protein
MGYGSILTTADTVDYNLYSDWGKWKRDNSLWHAIQPKGVLRNAFVRADSDPSYKGHASDVYRLENAMGELKTVQTRVSEYYAAGAIDKEMASLLMSPKVVTDNDGLNKILDMMWDQQPEKYGTKNQANAKLDKWRTSIGLTKNPKSVIPWSFNTGSPNAIKRGEYLSKVMQDNFLDDPATKLVYSTVQDIGSSWQVNKARLDFMLNTSKVATDELEKKFLSTLGDDWESMPNIQDWIDSGKAGSILGDSTTAFHKQVAGENYDKAIASSNKIPSKHAYIPSTELGGDPKLEYYGKTGSGINIADVFRGDGIFDTFKNIGKFALSTTFDALTASVDWVVDVGNGIDDLIDGENFWDVMGETGKKIVGLDVAEDAYNMFQNGDSVGALLKLNEFTSEFGTQLSPDAQKSLSAAFAKNLEEFSSEDPMLSQMRDDINVMLGGGELPETDIPTGDINVSPIKKTTMDELKQLLGILPGDGTDVDVIPALLGGEARKMADDPDIARMRELQGAVAETGYDVGEREALSAKARRELAGMARQQGMAAGAAAGGLRGASVGAQARSLAEQAMQKQADVTTEMDKASIARKDAARQQLATLAKDVSKFDIEKEEERKKRKGATTIGVQSLLSQEELGKQQLQLAGYPVDKV